MDARDAFKRLDEGDDGEYYAQDGWSVIWTPWPCGRSQA